ncbi:MAG: condensation domain-containing protein [Propionibacteriaceae bacterium]|nr:condensation domain-containing protein [Propionibacteriaceae bacterium]
MSSAVVSANIESIAYLTDEATAWLAFAADPATADRPGLVQHAITWQGAFESEWAANALTVTTLRHPMLRSVIVRPGPGPVAPVLWPATWRSPGPASTAPDDTSPADDRPVQAVLTQPRITFHVVDLTAYDAITRGRQAAQFQRDDQVRAFDLAAEPPLRLTVIRQTVDQALLLWTYHPAVIDEWSFPLVVTDFMTAYQRLRQGAEVETLLAQAHDQAQRAPHFQAWSRRQLAAPAADSYWLRVIAGVTEAACPAALGETTPPSHPAPRPAAMVELDQTQTEAVIAAAARLGVPLSAYVEAAWGLALQQDTGQSDVVFGIIRPGREMADEAVSGVVGGFSSLIPVRVHQRPDDTVGQFMARLSDQAIAQLARPRCRWSALAESPLGRGAAATIVSFLARPLDIAQLNQLSADVVQPLTADLAPPIRLRLASTLPAQRADCLVTGRLLAGQLRLSAWLGPAYARSDAQRMLQRWQAALSALAVTADTPLTWRPIVSEAERIEVLETFNAATFDRPADMTLTALIEQQAAARPTALALSAGARQLTWAELVASVAAEVERLAATDLSAGLLVEPTADRSLETVIRMLAVAQLQPANWRLPTVDGRSLVYSQTAFLNLALNPALDPLYDGDRPVAISVNSLASPDFVIETLTALARGVTVVLPTDDELSDATRFVQVLWQAGVTTLIIPPTDVVHLTSEPEFLGLLTGLRRIVLTWDGRAATLPAESTTEALERLALHTPEATWFRSYRPTGLALWASFGPVPAAVSGQLNDQIGPVGQPLANTQAYVLDGQRPCGIGQTGELCLAGEGLPEPQSAVVVTDNPFRPGPLVRTGDRARWLADGRLDIVRLAPVEPAVVAETTSEAWSEPTGPVIPVVEPVIDVVPETEPEPTEPAAQFPEPTVDVVPDSVTTTGTEPEPTESTTPVTESVANAETTSGSDPVAPTADVVPETQTPTDIEPESSEPASPVTEPETKSEAEPSTTESPVAETPDNEPVNPQSPDSEPPHHDASVGEFTASPADAPVSDAELTTDDKQTTDGDDFGDVPPSPPPDSDALTVTDSTAPTVLADLVNPEMTPETLLASADGDASNVTDSAASATPPEPTPTESDGTVEPAPAPAPASARSVTTPDYHKPIYPLTSAN